MAQKAETTQVIIFICFLSVKRQMRHMDFAVITILIRQVDGFNLVTMHMQEEHIHIMTAIRVETTTAGGGFAPPAVMVSRLRMAAAMGTSTGVALMSTMTMTAFARLCI